MNLIEIAVYALVLVGPSPALCRLDDGGLVVCSNGLTARALSQDAARFSNGVTVRRDGDNFPAFSNGVTSRFSSAGWLTFSNGVAVRRRAADRYDFASGVTCRAELPSLVACRSAAP